MTVTLETVATQIRSIATASPDFRYKDFVRLEDQAKGRVPRPDGLIACTYLTDDGEGSCIVGRAILDVADEDEFDEWQSLLNACEGQTAYNVLKDFDETKRDELILQWIGRVQGNQDNNEAWGSAVAEADEFYPLS